MAKTIQNNTYEKMKRMKKKHEKLGQY